MHTEREFRTNNTDICPEEIEMLLVKGLGISTGREIGKVHRITNVDFKLENIRIKLTDADDEIAKVMEAFVAAGEQITGIMDKTEDDDTRDILAAHLEISKDSALRNKVEMLIREERYSASDALYTSCEEFAAMLEGLNDEYMRQRAADIRDVCKRVYRAMIGIPDEQLECPSIVVADDLTPSILSSLEREYVLAFVSGTGGKTSHIAIMANGMGIPAVAGLGDEIREISAGDTVIVNGKNGYVYINPDDETRARFEIARQQDRKEEEERRKYIDKPAVTADGERRVEVCANIAFVNECENATAVGAEGVGLYRTEFLYMDSDTWPEEEEQFESYRKVLEIMAPYPVIIRTMDIGGDKALPYMEIEPEDNPFLGYRALRICLDNPEMFKTQLRALLRASAFGKLRIMFPMVSNLKEFREAKAYVEACKAELRAEGVAFDENVETGIMVEIPAAAIMADKLAEEVDFFSIGTNDLIQYTMAADRMNNKVAYLYDSLQPAVLRLISNVIEAAHAHGKFVGMCGEMAGAEQSIKLLVGMGLDEFSMSAGSILRFKSRIAGFEYKEAQAFAKECLSCSTLEEVCELIEKKGGCN